MGIAQDFVSHVYWGHVFLHGSFIAHPEGTICQIEGYGQFVSTQDGLQRNKHTVCFMKSHLKIRKNPIQTIYQTFLMKKIVTAPVHDYTTLPDVLS